LNISSFSTFPFFVLFFYSSSRELLCSSNFPHLLIVIFFVLSLFTPLRPGPFPSIPPPLPPRQDPCGIKMAAHLRFSDTRILDKTETRKRKWSSSHLWRVCQSQFLPSSRCRPRRQLFFFVNFRVLALLYLQISSQSDSGKRKGVGRAPFANNGCRSTSVFGSLFYPGLYLELQTSRVA